MYKRDETTLNLGKMKETIEVTCGIRQGCSISTLLFKMVTFCIIEDLLKNGKLYGIREYEGNSLWLADDATLIASSKEEVEENIKALIISGRKYGLNLNKLKTKIIQIRGRKELKTIDEYEVEEEVQYLGIKIGGRGRNIFLAENKCWIEKVERKANELIPQIRKSFYKIVVGKAIWKLMSIPGILFGRAVVVTP